MWRNNGANSFLLCDILQVGIGLLVLQQLGGTNGVLFYSSTIFKSAGKYEIVLSLPVHFLGLVFQCHQSTAACFLLTNQNCQWNCILKMFCGCPSEVWWFQGILVVHLHFIAKVRCYFFSLINPQTAGWLWFLSSFDYVRWFCLKKCYCLFLLYALIDYLSSRLCTDY